MLRRLLLKERYLSVKATAMGRAEKRCGRVSLKENDYLIVFYRSPRRRAQVPKRRLVQWWRHRRLLVLRHRIQLVRLYLYPPLGGLPRLLSLLPLFQMFNSLIAWSIIAQIPLSDDTPILNFWEWVDTCLCHAAYILLRIRVCMFFLFVSDPWPI